MTAASAAQASGLRGLNPDSVWSRQLSGVKCSAHPSANTPQASGAKHGIRSAVSVSA